MSTLKPSSEPSTILHVSRPTTIPTVNITPYIPDSQTTATSNISFVDASILSKLDLLLFEGNLLEFPDYWARFSTLVGDKPQLDGVTKFSLLKSTLRGRALHTIKGLSITATNYPIAVEILNHFDDRVTTRHILYTRIASLAPCDKDGRNLSALYSKMYALVRQFTTYEDGSKEYALGAILLNKLPRRIRSRIYDEGKNQENIVLTELLRILTKIVRKETTLEEMEDHRDNTNELHMKAAYQRHYKTNMIPNTEEPKFSAVRGKPKIVKKDLSILRKRYTPLLHVFNVFFPKRTLEGHQNKAPMLQLPILPTHNEGMSVETDLQSL
ncbi:hypothetical protein NECAME_17607 [Necator americanus]|uniref:Peptidase family A16 n=1 Tax=Necator americanus TaxID=51031 RepID=W2TP59_NECAM|nr:hypothetical protein NECAME_17607 [Necator americanus]ETN82921.1 hypothetical protein NECAME_17607 [Necator americanus]